MFVCLFLNPEFQLFSNWPFARMRNFLEFVYLTDIKKHYLRTHKNAWKCNWLTCWHFYFSTHIYKVFPLNTSFAGIVTVLHLGCMCLMYSWCLNTLRLVLFDCSCLQDSIHFPHIVSKIIKQKCERRREDESLFGALAAKEAWKEIEESWGGTDECSKGQIHVFLKYDGSGVKMVIFFFHSCHLPL